MLSLIIKAANVAELKAELLKTAAQLDTGESAKPRPTASVMQAAQDLRVEIPQTPFYPPGLSDVPPEKLTGPAGEAYRESLKEEKVPVLQQSIPGQLDSEGYAWDERIHASTKALNSDGSWRTRRGISSALYEGIKATLPRGTAVTPAPLSPVAPITPAFIPPAPVAAPEIPQFNPPTPAPVVQAPVAPQPSYDPIAIPQFQKPAHTLETFKENFIPCISSLVEAKKLDQVFIKSVNEHYGVAGIWDILKNEQHVSQLFDHLVNHGLITKVG